MILSEVCEFIVDCPHSTAVDEGIGYPLIRTPNVGKGRLILDSVHRVSEETYQKRNARAIPKAGDLIFAREAPAGNVALIQDGQEVCLGQRTVLIRPDTNKVDAAFLTYYILAPEQQYRLLGSANGATVAHVNLPIIRNLDILLPDILVQKAVSKILTAYDDLIENNQKQIKLLEEASQRLYKEWFVDLHFPGHEQTKIVDGVPEGWKRKKVKDCLEYYINGGWGKDLPTSNNKFKGCVIRGTDIQDIKCGRFLDIPVRFHSEMDIVKRVLKKYDLIIELSNGNINNIGRTLMLNENILNISGKNTICASFCKLLRPLDYFHSLILYWEIQEMQSSGRLLPFKKQGANGINNFAFEEFLQHTLLVTEDKRIINVLDFIMQKISVLQNQLFLFTEARDRLLPKLMNGEIEL